MLPCLIYFIVRECLKSDLLEAGIINNVECMITVKFTSRSFDISIGQNNFNSLFFVYLFVLETQAIDFEWSHF